MVYSDSDSDSDSGSGSGSGSEQRTAYSVQRILVNSHQQRAMDVEPRWISPPRTQTKGILGEGREPSSRVRCCLCCLCCSDTAWGRPCGTPTGLSTLLLDVPRGDGPIPGVHQPSQPRRPKPVGYYYYAHPATSHPTPPDLAGTVTHRANLSLIRQGGRKKIARSPTPAAYIGRF